LTGVQGSQPPGADGQASTAEGHRPKVGQLNAPDGQAAEAHIAGPVGQTTPVLQTKVKVCGGHCTASDG
jgi:hypothetical protein